MGLGFDWDRLKAEWNGSKEVLKGDAIWNPLTQEYVKIQPGTDRLPPPPDLSEPKPNSTEARLAHIQILVANGIITEQEGAEARKRVLEGM
jgi:hypothetical protein